ncbi:DUF1707 SHOCT-like domain-containing protein [Nocardia brasiliensis]|uniref:DUF1707 SHOCT-like domain-containing protein n=1 Tax=Nocardia brasiliensis TaxID=37326 RepID=UPI002458CFD1|nr:DUF1707 domain-containing protein [Nocardia brasiliensis]
MVDIPGARITADERDRALRELSAHLVAGRLSLVEFDERSSLAAAVTTKTEMAALFTDLPGQVPSRHDAARRTRVSTRALLVALGTVVLLITFLTFLVIGAWWWLVVPTSAAAATGVAVVRARSRRFRGQ